MDGLQFNASTPAYLPDVSIYENAISKLQEENVSLQDAIGRREADMHKMRMQFGSVREERDRLKRRTRELQTRVQSLEASTSPHNSRTSTPTKHPAVNPATGERYKSYYFDYGTLGILLGRSTDIRLAPTWAAV